MNIEYIEYLAMNPFLTAKIMQTFLTGYKNDCSISLLLKIIPVVYNSESRTLLQHAKITSRIDTIFGKVYPIKGSKIKISKEMRFKNYDKRYVKLRDLGCEGLIILYSDGIVCVDDYIKVHLNQENDYKKENEEMKKILKPAHNLGLILSKCNEDDFNHYLGV